MILNSINFTYETLDVHYIFNSIIWILDNMHDYFINFSISIGVITSIIIFMSGSGKKLGEKFLGWGSQVGSTVSGAAGAKYLYDDLKKSSSDKNKATSGSSKGKTSGDTTGKTGSSNNKSGGKSGK